MADGGPLGPLRERERKGGSNGEKCGVTKVLVFLVFTKHD